ncbi:hypothetical protein LguiB_005821 [Lonicera macranthoides]
MMVSLCGSTVYPPGHSLTIQGGFTNWPFRASFVSNPRGQGLSSYAPINLPQEVVSVPGWNACSDQGSLSSPESQQQETCGNSQIYRTSRQTSEAAAAANLVGSQGAFSSYCSSGTSVPVGYYAL